MFIDYILDIYDKSFQFNLLGPGVHICGQTYYHNYSACNEFWSTIYDYLVSKHLTTLYYEHLHFTITNLAIQS